MNDIPADEAVESSKKSPVVPACCCLLIFVILGGFGALFFLLQLFFQLPAGPGKGTRPEKLAFDAVTAKITGGESGLAQGNSPEAKELAKRFSLAMGPARSCSSPAASQKRGDCL